MPGQRTRLVYKEPARFNVNVATVIETRILDEGRIGETGFEYSIWKEKPAPERRMHRVDFAVRISLVHVYILLPKAINERLMSFRISLPYDNFMTHVSLLSNLWPWGTCERQVNWMNSSPPLNQGTNWSSSSTSMPVWWMVLRPGPVVGNGEHENCNDNGLGLNGIFPVHKLPFSTSQHERRPPGSNLDPNNCTLWIIPSPERATADMSLITRPIPDDWWMDHRLLMSQIQHPNRQTSMRQTPRDTEIWPARTDWSKRGHGIDSGRRLSSCNTSSAQQITEVWTSFAKETMEYTKIRQQGLFDQNVTDIAQLNEANSKAKI